MATSKVIAVGGLGTGVTIASVTPSEEWLSTALSGTNITVSTTSANTSTTANRTATVNVVASDGATASFSVTQNKRSVITVTPNSVTFDAAGNVLS